MPDENASRADNVQREPMRMLFGMYEPYVPDMKTLKAPRIVTWRHMDKWIPAHSVVLPMVNTAATTGAPIRVVFTDKNDTDIDDAVAAFVMKMLPCGKGPRQHDKTRDQSVMLCFVSAGDLTSKLVLMDEICIAAKNEHVEVSVVWDESGDLDDVAYLKSGELRPNATPGDITQTAYYHGDLSKLDGRSAEKCFEEQKAAEWMFAIRHQYLMWCELVQNNNSHFPLCLDKKMSDYLSCGLVEFPEGMEDVDADGNAIAYICDEYEVFPKNGDVCFCLAKREPGEWCKTCETINYGAQMYMCVEAWLSWLERKGGQDEFPSLMEMWLGRDLSSGKMLDITGLASGYPEGAMETGDERMYERVRFLRDKYQMGERVKRALGA